MLAALLVAATLPFADAAAQSRDAAVLAARNGDYATALATLTGLRERDPGSLPVLHDLIVVLAWSGDDAGASSLAASLDPAAAPRYVQLAVAKSARNLRNFALAGDWYDAALARDAGDVDALAGRLLTAVDAGDPERVRALLAVIGGRADDNETLGLARAYALVARGEPRAALAAYDKVLARKPSQQEALRGKAMALRALLLPSQALALAAAHPGILTPAEIERLRVDELAVRLRLTVRTPYPEPDIYANADLLLAGIDAQIAAMPPGPGRDTLLIDRVVALSDTNQAEAAIAQFESLPASANRNQAYLLAAAARAYLQARQPKPALELLEQGRAIAPDNLQIRFALVYAWLDLNRYRDAFALAAELVASLPLTNQTPGSNVVKGNDERIRAEILAGIADAYGDQLEGAQARFETLLAAAPGNAEMRQELASVYRWRGWLDRSLEEYQRILATDAEMLGAELGLAHARLDAREFAAVDATLEKVVPVYGREPAVRDLAERWAVHNDNELILTASTGDSTGPVAGADNHAVDARWYSAPIAYRFRALVATHDGFADYAEGESRRRRAAVGLEYRLPSLTLTATVSGSRGNDAFGDADDTGAVLAFDYRVGDRWTVDAGAESNSDAVQLRAHRQGIAADRAYLGASFAPSELAGIGFGYDNVDYSDGNAIASFYTNGRYRLANKPRSKLDATARVAVGRADTSAVAYYSPEDDQSWLLGLAWELSVHRRYERSLRQTLSASTGRYEQKGFPSGPIWSAAWRLDWRLGRRHTLGFAAERLGQRFDGVREHSTVATFSMNSRF